MTKGYICKLQSTLRKDGVYLENVPEIK